MQLRLEKLKVKLFYLNKFCVKPILFVSSFVNSSALVTRVHSCTNTMKISSMKVHVYIISKSVAFLDLIAFRLTFQLPTLEKHGMK